MAVREDIVLHSKNRYVVTASREGENAVVDDHSPFHSTPVSDEGSLSPPTVICPALTVCPGPSMAGGGAP